MTSIKDRIMSGIRAFREAYLSADLVFDETDFGDFEARKLRYTLYWSYYENSAYRSLVHKWAHSYKVQYGLYKHIRSIYNPAYRLGEFWKTYLWGGKLDMTAGDGQGVPSALPILTENDKLRETIATLWRHSNWQVKKDTCTLWGSILGDVAIKVIDDPIREKVYLKIIHPGTIKALDLDPFSNIKGYTIEVERPDPRNPSRKVIYREVAFRDGDNVVYQTYLDNDLYAWDGEEPEWAEPYGFIPMVFIKHNDVGFDWGWSEFHSAHPKFREVDDIASKLSDQIRKMVDSAWLLSGVQKPTRGKQNADTSDSLPTGNPETSREEIPAFYGPIGASATPLVTPLDIGATTAYLASLLKILEQEYPELSSDIHNVTGDISGRALRINQMPTENKVKERRPNYDDALMRVHQMAVAIGGFRGYTGFKGFDLDSYGSGTLDHQIADRPVFTKDPLDDLETEQRFWAVAKEAQANGIPIDFFLEEHGWTSERIAKVTGSAEYKARQAGLQQLALLGEGQNEGSPDEDADTGFGGV
jgi:hypothetical protein